MTIERKDLPNYLDIINKVIDIFKDYNLSYGEMEDLCRHHIVEAAKSVKLTNDSINPLTQSDL